MSVGSEPGSRIDSTRLAALRRGDERHAAAGGGRVRVCRADHPTPRRSLMSSTTLYFVARSATRCTTETSSIPIRGGTGRSIDSRAPSDSTSPDRTSTYSLGRDQNASATSTSDCLTRTVERWYGNVLTYDRERASGTCGSDGRREIRHDGALRRRSTGDVSFPNPASWR